VDQAILSVKGRNGQLDLLPDRLRISRDGIRAFALQGLKGDKEIYYSDISSVQFKQPGWTVGYIQFAFSGGFETKKGVFNASIDENTVTFSHNKSREFEIFKVELDRRIANAKKPVYSSMHGLIELEKLAELKEKGILTEEEFTAKKEELLGKSNSQELSAEHQQELKQMAQEDAERNKKATNGCLGCLGFLLLGFLALVIVAAEDNMANYFSPALLWGIVSVSLLMPVVLAKKWNWLLKKRYYILVFIILVFVFSWLGGTNPKYKANMAKEAEQRKWHEAVAKLKERRNEKEASESGSLSAEHFRWIEPGMTYDRVVAILGRGELGSQTSIGNIDTRAYTWKKWTGANAIITFQNGRVVSKTQYGLD
jgi:hypothetical protein